MELRHPRSANEVLDSVRGQTVPRLFARTVATNLEAPALHWRVGDGWAHWTWAEYANRALRLAAALRQLGVRRGDRVALMMRNRPEFHPADMAAYLVGATAFSIYNSSSVEQVAYVLRHSEAAVAIVGEADPLALVQRARAAAPDLRQVIAVDEPAEPSPDVLRWEDLVATPPLDLDDAAAVAAPDDIATFIYTSGTTGPPKAVMLTHRNVSVVLEAFVELFGIDLTGRRLVSYLPMAHIAERLMTHYLPARAGVVAHIFDDPAAIPAELPTVRPEIFFGPPRIFEKLCATLRLALGDAPGSGRDANRHALAAVGLDQCRIAFTGAAPPPADVLRLFGEIGLPVAETYGLSESTGLVAADMGEHRPGHVGPPVPGCEVRLLDDGEILARSPAVFAGYYKDAERTAAAVDADGWLHTGDIGTIDDGVLRIVDRKKELIVTSGGKNISPANLERALKLLPLVGQACVVGDGRPYVTAVLALDPDAASAWASTNGHGGTSLHHLAELPELRAEIEGGVAAINARVSNVERIKRFALVSDEWLPDSDVLTPTMKLKRRGVLERYGRAIDALYAERG